MTSLSTTAPTAGHPSWFARSENWLDEKGKGAWIAAMVLGFIFCWPVGLALLLYMIWRKRMFSKSQRTSNGMGRHAMHTMKSTGNSAFDAYKADTLRRLEEEKKTLSLFWNVCVMRRTRQNLISLWTIATAHLKKVTLQPSPIP